MDSGFYAAVTGLISRTDALDIVADNLANVDTTGYKARHEFYQALADASKRSADPLNEAINNYGVFGGTTTDLRPGSIERTGNQLDLALEGPGFLTVEAPSGIRYTRNGSLHLGVKGELLTAAGDRVLATSPDPRADPVPITLPEGPISVSTDGTISSEETVVAQLNLVAFSKGTQLTPEGSGYFQAPKGAASPATEVAVRQGCLEASNYNPVDGTVDLITVERHAQLLERALSIFDSDFAQAATQDLPRVE